MSKTIPPLDLMFLLTETSASPKHVSALMTFEMPAHGGANTVRRIAEAYRAAKPIAPFNYVSDFGLSGPPRWKAARALDLARHVHHIALPAGATHDDLLGLLQTLHETVLDRGRPAYDLYLIEGLPGGGFAIFVKVHHAIVDGASAMSLLLGSMNDDANSKRIVPFYAVELTQAKARPPKALVERIVALQSTARKQTTALASLSFGMLKKTLGRLLPVGAKAGSEPFTVSRTPLNAPLQASRTIATLSLPIAEMRATGKAFGGTLNDVAVAIVDAGLHRYLAGLGSAASKPLVGMCPISLREPGDKEITTKVTAMFVPLGKPSAPVAERLRTVIANAAAAKEELRAMSKDTAMLYAIAAFGLAEVEAELSKRVSALPARPLASFVLSNVPGTANPLYLNGARMTGMFPISAVAAGMGMNATLASYAGSMDFGFVANGSALPNLTELARHTREAFDELKAAAAALPAAAATEATRAPAAAAQRVPAKRAARKSAGSAPKRAAAKTVPRKAAPSARRGRASSKMAAAVRG